MYLPTPYEKLSNVFSHLICVPISVYLAFDLFNFSDTIEKNNAIILYATGLILLFTISTVFHLSCYAREDKNNGEKYNFFSIVRRSLHIADRVTIYFYISASFTPWITLRSFHYFDSNQILSTIWIATCIGIVFQYVIHEKHKLIETMLYLIVASIPSFFYLLMEDLSGVWVNAIAGLTYLIGLIFFKSDGKILFAHTIWHGFVAVGAYIQYYAIANYLLKCKDYSF